MKDQHKNSSSMVTSDSIAHGTASKYGTMEYVYEMVPTPENDIEKHEMIIDSSQFSNKCSALETTCNLIAVITGSGMLSLPFAAKSMGWSALLALLFLGVMFMYSFQLLVESIGYYRRRFSDYHYHTFEHQSIDYIAMGKFVFGSLGEKLVLIVFAIEMMLALTSFFINIGLNFHVIIPSMTVSGGIFIAAIVTIILALFELNIAAYSSALGLTMTIFTIIALIWSGEAFNHDRDELVYGVFQRQGLSMSLGLIAFCFGGHATFPKMYEAMAEPSRYRQVLITATIVVLSIYATFLVLGYYYYAQYTLAPSKFFFTFLISMVALLSLVVTLNIGEDLNPFNHRYGKLLRRLAAIGVISNLQVTCPLVTLPLRDVLLRFGEFTFSDRNLHLTSTLIIICTAGLSLLLEGQFAATCAFVGSVATFTNSMILPIVFFQRLSGSDCSLTRRILHLVILMIAFGCAFSSIYGNFEAIFESIP